MWCWWIGNFGKHQAAQEGPRCKKSSWLLAALPVKEVKGGKPFKARVESRFKTDGTLRPSASVATLDVSHYEYFVTIQQQLNKDLRRLFFKHAQFQVYTFNILYEKLFFVQGYKLLFNSSCFWQIRF